MSSPLRRSWATTTHLRFTNHRRFVPARMPSRLWTHPPASALQAHHHPSRQVWCSKQLPLVGGKRSHLVVLFPPCLWLLCRCVRPWLMSWCGRFAFCLPVSNDRFILLSIYSSHCIYVSDESDTSYSVHRAKEGIAILTVLTSWYQPFVEVTNSEWSMAAQRCTKRQSEFLAWSYRAHSRNKRSW